MRFILVLLLLVSMNCYSQWKSYVLGDKGDTLNCVGKDNLKQGKWVVHHDELRGEPGFEEEGVYKDDRKEGVWRLYSLEGDLIGIENYKWGNKDGINQYFARTGELLREESWKALNPNKQYDTLEIEDVDHLDSYKKVIVKNEGVGLKHGTWKYYDPSTGAIWKTETYTLGKLDSQKIPVKNNIAANDSTKAAGKPKEVKDFEKKYSGKKKAKVVDGSVNY